jgi:hypothetical protein
MNTWVYLAGEAQANQADTINFAKNQNLIWRPARNTLGRVIANVGNLQPGDRILLVYRPGHPYVARVVANIAEPAHPVLGAEAIERIEWPGSQPLLDVGYPPVDSSKAVEVIRLEDVTECEILLRGTYGMGAIHRLAPEDAGVLAVLPGPEPSYQAEEHPKLADAVTDAVQGLVGASPDPIRPPDPPSNENFDVRAIRTPDTAGRSLFDAYVMVDWSSKREPALGPDSIWIAWGWWDGDDLREDHANEATRATALRRIGDLLTVGFAGRRVLLGFDFAFGYPCGFASALGLKGLPWKEILNFFGGKVQDDLHNHHNRDAFAALCNTRINGGGPGPFWGCHQNAAGPALTTCRVGVFNFPYAGLEEYRETERRARENGIQPQSVWKLNQGVAVGGQTILGIKYIAELHSQGEMGDRITIWPFETGWLVPGGDDRVVVAEIFPSVLPIEDDLAEPVRDLAQVRTCVRHAATLDACDLLEKSFEAPRGLPASRLAAVAQEEGWILFVR